MVTIETIDKLNSVAPIQASPAEAESISTLSTYSKNWTEGGKDGRGDAHRDLPLGIFYTLGTILVCAFDRSLSIQLVEKSPLNIDSRQ